jgi:DNA repair exonuclease SbcCD ATPase subunit
MIVPSSLAVRGWAQWKQASLNLDTKGLCFVRGRNKDDLGNPNRVGKSTLFNAMSALLYGEHQLAVRKRSLKVLTQSDTRITLKFANEDHDVVADMRGNKLQVSVDGNRIEAHKAAGEQAELQAQYKISSDLHYATVHINGIASNPLIRGTSGARCQFLERAFDLDRWSHLHTKVGEVVSAMRKSDEELERVRGELEDLGPKIDVGSLREKVQSLQTKKETVSQWLEKALTVRGRIEALPPKPKLKVSELESMLVGINRRLKSVEKLADSIEAWNSAVEKRRELKDRLQKLDKPEPQKYNVAQIEHRLRKVQGSLQGTDHYDERAYDDIVEWRRIASSLAKSHGITWSHLDHLHVMSHGWVKNWQGGQTACPVCGSRLKERVDGNFLKKLAVVLRRLPDRIYEPEKLDNILRLRAEETKIYNMLERARAAEQAAVEIADIRRQLADTPLPKRQPQAIDLNRLESRRDDVASQLSAARQHARVRIPDGLTAASLDVRIDNAKILAGKITDALDKSKALLQKAEADRTKRSELITRKEKLEDEVALRPAYRALQMAYSPNGMRLWLLQELIESLISGLNDQASSVRDGHQYGYKLSRNRDLTLTASNLRGTYDIRFLSGAESSMFVLGLLTVLLPMLPSSRRSSLLILDEVDANCSNRSRQIIAAEYLPRLKKTVDSIFVITPMLARDFHVSGAREMLVTKRGGISSLSGG